MLSIDVQEITVPPKDVLQQRIDDTKDTIKGYKKCLTELQKQLKTNMAEEESNGRHKSN